MNKAEIMTKKHDKKCPLAPHLRFPEFRDEWYSQALGTIASIIKEKAGDKKCTLMSIITGVGLISQIDKFGKEIAGNQYKNYIILRKGDFAYNKSATKDYPQGFIALYTGNEIAAVPNSIFTCFKVQPESIVPAYLNYLFLGNFHGKWLRRYITVGARAHGSLSIDDDDLLSLPIPYPKGVSSLGEQQKIADCLSSLDERIAAETSKLDRLKDHKKGLLKQLFPAEGETLPQLRFPEFRNAGEWENVQLGPQTTKVGSGVTPRVGDRNYIKQGRPFIRSQNVGWGELILDDIVFISEEIHRTFISTEIEKNDILLNITGASIGRSAFADSRIAGGNVNQHVCIIRTKPSLLNSLFLMQYILSEYGQKQVDSFQAGGNRQGLNFAQVKSFSIPTPPQSTVMQCACLEQQRIADCLSSLDELIAAQTQKIDLLKEHKKGLMQQLFPRIDEVLA